MKKTFIVLFLLAMLLPADIKPIKFTLGNWLWKPASNQALLTTSSPTFAGLTLSGGTASTLAYLNGSKAFTSLANSAGYLLNDGSGGLSWGAVSLSGLVKADGTVPLTADWNAGVFDLTIGSITSTATAANEATTGDTLISNGNFATNDLTGWTAAAGWSAATGKAVHSAGDTTALVQAVSVTNGSTYQVAVTTSGRSAGTLTVQMGALAEAYDVYLNDTYYKTFTATATASINLIFTPNTDFNGAVDDVSVKLVSPNATPHFALNDSTATLTAEVRSNAALKNLGIGIFALRYNTTGYENTAIGYHAGQSITNGFYNVVLGAEALSQATTGHRNTAIGYGAFQLTTTGKAGTAVGAYALQQNTTGNYNTGIGYNALNANLTGTYNVALGHYSGMTNTSGIYNLFLGAWAGRYAGATGTTSNTTSDYSVCVGHDTRSSADNVQNEIVIGYAAVGAGSNTVRLGNTSVTDVQTSGSYASQKIINTDSDTDEIDSLTWAGGYGVLIVSCTTDGATGIYRLEGTTLTDISVNALFAKAKDNAGTYNIYFESGALKIQNKVGDNKVIRAGFFGI